MKLVFDCFKQVKGVGKSIGIYNLTLNTIRNMAAEKARSNNSRVRESELVVIGNPYNMQDFAIDGVEFISITDLDPRKKLHALIWELFRVSTVCKEIGADRVVFPRGYTALTHPVKDTAIINDMIPFYYYEHYPEFFNKLENAYIMRRLLQSAKTSDHVVTISEASKKIILDYVKIAEDKITVLYPGCNRIEKITGNVLSDDYAQSEDYIIAVTSSFPHKNAKGIIDCYNAYYHKSSHPLKLVVIGLENLDGFKVDVEVSSHIRCFKYIPDNKDLHMLIAGARMFLFLSVAEGFGFPPLEAMQLSVPVVCSDRMSLPEVVGDSAITVNPDDTDAVALKLVELETNDSLRAELVSLGEKNVERFSWETLAPKYWEVYLG